MDNYNFRNMILAYNAVHDDVLCESMDQLGFFDDDLEEGYKKLPVGRMLRQAAGKPFKAARAYEDASFGNGRPRKMNTIGGEPNYLIKKALKQAAKMARVAERHSTIRGKGRIRGMGQALLNRLRGEARDEARDEAKNEGYDIYGSMLNYLIDEGYTDSVDGAVSIIENMSDDWINLILEEI